MAENRDRVLEGRYLIEVTAGTVVTIDFEGIVVTLDNKTQVNNGIWLVEARELRLAKGTKFSRIGKYESLKLQRQGFING